MQVRILPEIGDNKPYYWTRQGVSLEEVERRVNALLDAGGIDVDLANEVLAARDQAVAAAAAAEAAAAGAGGGGGGTGGAVTSVAGKTGVVTLVKGDVGLANVDNTADSQKPLSVAQQNALDLKAPLAGAALVNPTTTTPAADDNSTRVANTQWVTAALGVNPAGEVAWSQIQDAPSWLDVSVFCPSDSQPVRPVPPPGLGYHVTWFKPTPPPVGGAYAQQGDSWRPWNG